MKPKLHNTSEPTSWTHIQKTRTDTF